MYNKNVRSFSKDKLRLFIFIIIYSINLIFYIISNSAIDIGISSSVFESGILIISFVLVVGKFFIFDKVSPKIFLLFFITIIIGMVVYLESKDKSILEVIILLWGAFDIDFDHIIKIYLIISITMLILLLFLTQVHVISNFQYARGDGTLRLSFGYGQPTIFAATIFYIFASLVYYFQSNKIINFIAFIIIPAAYFLQVFSNARNDMGCLLLLFLAIYISKLLSNKRKFGLPYIAGLAFVIIVFSSIILTYNYNSSSKFYFLMNNLLSNRLSLGNYAFKHFPLTLFGQYIYQLGNGGGRVQIYDYNYFFIDSSFIQLFIANGVVIFLMFVTSFYFRMNSVLKNKHYLLILIVLIALIEASWERTFFNIGMNPFIFILTAYVTTKVKQSKVDNGGDA